MNTKRKDEQVEASEIELLLPWHAAGTLSRRDAARVEQALANDNELAARYEQVREELGETILDNESLGAPSARAMKDLFAKIDAEPARKPAMSFNLGGRITEFFAGFAPRTLAYGATAAALAIVLQAGLIAGVLMNETRDGHQLASHTVGVTNDGGSFVLIRFNPDATANEIGKFLAENKATIVGGPSAAMFRLKVADKALSQAELGDIVKRMAQNKTVVGFTVPAAQP